jgi:hypothetical protein
MAGQLVEIFLLPHYVAPFTAAFYAIGLQAMRHLRLWTPEKQPVGTALTRLIVALCFVLAGVRLAAAPLHLSLPGWPGPWASHWYGSDRRAGTTRAQIESHLEQIPGRELAIVRYSPEHNSLDEWVYNAADIDNSKVVWAREMDETSEGFPLSLTGPVTVQLSVDQEPNLVGVNSFGQFRFKRLFRVVGSSLGSVEIGAPGLHRDQ